MANIKSAKKRAVSNELNRQRNIAIKSRLRTSMKEALTAIDAKDAEKVKKTLTEALSEIDRAVAKGVIHANSGARKKSHLQRRAHAI